MATQQNPTKKDVYDVVTARIMELLDKGIVPWRKPWRGGRAGMPKNLASGKGYRGINTFLLHCASMSAGYDSPYWLTYKQAQERGGNVRKGEHGMPVVFWNWVEKEKTDAAGNAYTEGIPFLRYYTVFNVEQCEGIDYPKLDAQGAPLDFQPIAACEAVVDGFTDRTKYMSVDEVKQLRTVTGARAIVDLKAGRVNGVLGWMVVDLALSMGLRVSEIARLTVENIDFKRGCLSVTRAKKRKKNGPESLAIGKELADHLRDFLAWRSCRLDDLNGCLPKSVTAAKGALFIGCRGPLTAQGLQRVWKAAIKRAGLPAELGIHSARHTVAIHLLKKTGNLRQVQKQLGDSSPTITATMYADVTFEDMQDGLNGLYS